MTNEKGGGSKMSIEILFLASFTLIGGTLLARLAIRGIERGRFAIAPEYKANRIRAGKKLLAPNID